LGVLVLASCLGWFALTWLGGKQGPVPRASGSPIVAEPAEQVRISLERIHAKGQVVERLADGELTLVEAAAWFRYLNDNPPGFPARFRELHPGRSDGEKACRQVIQWVELHLVVRMPKSQTTALAGRLRAELDQLLAERGEIALPW
jgi:hypothetical protein